MLSQWLQGLLGIFFLLSIPAQVLAMSVDGVTIPDQVQADHQKLILNGSGLRTATLLNLKVYLAGLYLSQPSHNAEEILNSQSPKGLELRFLRDLPSEKLTHAWTESFEKNCGKKCDQMKPLLNQLNAMMIDVKKGDRLSLLFYPDFVEVRVKDQPAQKIMGSDYSKTLLLTWLGPNPPNPELKRGLLGSP